VLLAVSPPSATALAAICGSLIGGLTSGFSTWITQRHQDRGELLCKRILQREALYSDFIVESERLLIDALEHDECDPKSLIPVYPLLSRIRLTASPHILAIAEQVVKKAVGTYARPNLTAQEIKILALNSGDPLKEFSESCRVEIESIRKQL